MFSRRTTRAAAVLGAVAVLCGVLVVVRGLTSPSAVAQQEEPALGRIAFAGTGHRSIGAPSEPLFGAGPAHFDDDVSARGNLVVFTSLRDGPRPQVYLRAADGSVRRLTTDRDAGHPRLSPDLSTVVFDSAEDGQRDLWLVGVDGTGPRRLTDTPDDETWPTFSPDGTQVAFARAGQIYRQPTGGGQVVQVTDEPAGTAGEPAWNPGDNRIAYTLNETQIRVVDGSGVGTPLLGGDQAGWQTRWPVWKPDGASLLFLSQGRVYQTDMAAAPVLLLDEDRDVASPAWLDGRLLVSRTSAPTRNTATLQDIRPDGADPRDLGLPVLREDPEAVDNPNLLFRPRPGFDPWTQREEYSPDGRQIVVTRFEDVDGVRAQRLWLVDADGANPRRVPVADRQTTDWEFDPAWSPDGRFIAFARRSPGGVRPTGGPSHVVVVDVATGAVVGRLSPPPEVADQEDTQPAWSPDGTLLSFTRGLITDGPNGEIRDNHVWTARTGTLDQQRDVSTVACGFDCAVTDDSSTFSPDSGRLVFNRERDGLVEVTLPDSCAVLLPGGANTCATPLTAPAGPFQPRDAAFSPAGDQIVVTTRRAAEARSPEELAVLDPATGQLDRIATGLPGRQKEPAWQPTADLAVAAPGRLSTVEPGRGAPVTVTVTNRGPAAVRDTTLTVAVPEGARLDALRPARGTCVVADLRCDLGALAPGESVEIDADLVGLTRGRQRVTWSAAGDVVDARLSDNAAETELPVRGASPPPPPPTPRAGPGLAVVVQPNPSYVGGRATVRYTVRNGGGGLATGLRLDFALPSGIPVVAVPPGCSATGCALPDLTSGASAVVLVVLAPAAPVRTTAGGRLRTTGTDADPNDNVANAPMVVLEPRIVAVPPIGEPGFVTSVRGLDFPPGVPVRLTWSPGITAAAAPTVPRGDGRFIAQLLILNKDQTGPRTITATGAGFKPATTPFLVVSGTIAPPDMVGRR